MTVIPAINEIDFESVKKRIDQAIAFGAHWIHLDVADAKFTKNVLWNNPAELKSLNLEKKINLEVHLMVENPNKAVDGWLSAGIKRVIIHAEALALPEQIKLLEAQCRDAKVELFIASNVDTLAEQLLKYKDVADGFLVLAVIPGTTGQNFQEHQLDKIKFLRTNLPDVKIEVDGGVNLKTAPKIKQAGADILISASYIWKSINPKEAYEKLSLI